MTELKNCTQNNPCGRSGGWLGLESEREILYKKIEDFMHKMGSMKEHGPFDQFLSDANLIVVRQTRKQNAIDALKAVFDYAYELHATYSVTADFLNEQIQNIICEISNEKMKAHIVELMIHRIMNNK